MMRHGAYMNVPDFVQAHTLQSFTAPNNLYFNINSNPSLLAYTLLLHHETMLSKGVLMNVQLKLESKKICPLLREPMEECYCNSMSSQDIEKTIFFCSGGYKTCAIYKLKQPVMCV